MLVKLAQYQVAEIVDSSNQLNNVGIHTEYDAHHQKKTESVSLRVSRQIKVLAS